MGKKLLSILLLLCLLTALLTVSALAATEVRSADALQQALEAGGEIQLTASFEVNATETETISNAVTLDLNGHTLTWKTSTQYAIQVTETGSLTILDNSEEKKGELNIISTYDGSTLSAGICVNGRMQFQSGTVSYQHGTKSGRVIDVLTGGNFSMSGGTIEIGGYVNYGLSLRSGNETHITGGEIVFNKDTSAEANTTVYGVYAYNGDTSIEGLTVS